MARQAPHRISRRQLAFGSLLSAPLRAEHTRATTHAKHLSIWKADWIRLQRKGSCFVPNNASQSANVWVLRAGTVDVL
ncbi:hypothetical protein RISK_004273 [Rhodopirellula islandica]|uniref:Uncharacterized protein n=1 Tax=Rhodopirellula islandica TaxID=595434 RepID=A0A0J1BBF7_RHOIS|nr:hypothetical protein RISK_004273 [Rhodopirellula islandica]